MGEEYCRREQTGLKQGVRSSEFTACLGVMSTIGAGMWDVLGRHWGQVVEIRQPRKGGPDHENHELQAEEFILQC